jgi:hypothetical protein
VSFVVHVFSLQKLCAEKIVHVRCHNLAIHFAMPHDLKVATDPQSRECKRAAPEFLACISPHKVLDGTAKFPLTEDVAPPRSMVTKARKAGDIAAGTPGIKDFAAR